MRDLVSRYRSVLLIAGTLVIFISVGAYIYMYKMRSQAQMPGVPDASQPALTASSTEELPHRTAPEGWRLYWNPQYHFSLFYPAGANELEYIEPNGGHTTVFEDVRDKSHPRGFQIYMTPYDKSQIDDAQFKKDLPSGVREDVEEFEIDGAKAAAFHSIDTDLGPVREIWFIHGGYLYEVTAPRALDTYIEPIMRTWQFE